MLYDGGTGDKVREVGAGSGEAHTAGIFSVAWSPDSTRLMTASADRTVKVWDVAQDTLLQYVGVALCVAPG